MRASVLLALSLSLTGCVAVTQSGTEETLRFSGVRSQPEDAQAVLKPYNDLPMSIEFTCPTRLATMMTSYVVPLPPVVPVGRVIEPVSYLRVRVPAGAENALAQMRILTQPGTTIPLSDARKTQRAASNDGTVEATYAMSKECAAFNGALLQVAAFSYKDKQYPATEARLHFDSRITGGLSWWPPIPFNGGRSIRDGGIDASAASAR